MAASRLHPDPKNAAAYPNSIFNVFKKKGENKGFQAGVDSFFAKHFGTGSLDKRQYRLDKQKFRQDMRTQAQKTADEARQANMKYADYVSGRNPNAYSADPSPSSSSRRATMIPSPHSDEHILQEHPHVQQESPFPGNRSRRGAFINNELPIHPVVPGSRRVSQVPGSRRVSMNELPIPVSYPGIQEDSLDAVTDLDRCIDDSKMFKDCLIPDPRFLNKLAARKAMARFGYIYDPSAAKELYYGKQQGGRRRRCTSKKSKKSKKPKRRRTRKKTTCRRRH